ncbi:ATP-grasp domain-containing protein [Mycobacterium sp. KBS0706]|uniref:acetyl-CoA carboxylase biotin carboxylase subunit n=1 Tax=Mycobacterium sp. KBS0706 TaxID=2578109 RepID=UPI00110FEF24|nr:biotin carboxylase N-terminal domain-containing protein [Mycobacterium sp. KBS0706]TSD90046.1 ATP-grasp domain-containing protein [Mycobacterium sp. KBS0706]
MKTLLIANRGEIACRIIRSAKALGLAAVAVHSDADAKALHVALADRAVHIGPSKPAESYLKIDAILKAARGSGADAVHPGYGFLAENEGFARAVAEAGLTWVGPTPESIEAMGDKARARALAESAGVPVLPGSRRFAEGELEGIEAAGETVGYPLLVKASAGGGGIGMRVVDAPAELRKVADSTQGMAARSFGDGAVFLERYVRNARHVEVQVFGFGDGRAIHLFERECSVQRRFQKIVEESPSPGISTATRARMTAAAVALAEAVRYRGAGTMEFVVDADSEAFFFLEMNTRIQVEHPVTEAVTGLDLVALQLRLAAGEDPALRQEDIRQQGHAIECRLYAENPAKMFLPQPGTLARLALPEGMRGIRVDTGVRQGDAVTPFYDPMIAKIIAHGPDRAAAIDRMLAALGRVEVEGLVANAPFLARVVGHPAFRAGRTTTSFVDTHKAGLIG